MTQRRDLSSIPASETYDQPGFKTQATRGGWEISFTGAMAYDVPDPQMGFTPPYSVEIFECLTWFEVDHRNDLEETMWIASAYAERLGCKRVMVTDAKCKEV